MRLALKLSDVLCGLGSEMISNGGNFGTNAAWGVANKAFYFPIYVTEYFSAVKLYTTNGTTATGNLDMGIYASSGFVPTTRLVSIGSTAQAGTSVVQEFDITDTILFPSTLYFLAMACSSASSTIQYIGGTPQLGAMRFAGVMQETSAFPLPSTATPAVLSTNVMVPDIGMASTTLVA